MEFVAKTDVGLRRSNNEDSYFAKKYNDEISLYIVADGLGGYEGGEIATTSDGFYYREDVVCLECESTLNDGDIIEN